jgi:hypothetical protein
VLDQEERAALRGLGRRLLLGNWLIASAMTLAFVVV